jgi:hypothetical protein
MYVCSFPQTTTHPATNLHLPMPKRSFASLANSTFLPINNQVHALVERTMCMYRKRNPNQKLQCRRKELAAAGGAAFAIKENDNVADENLYNMYWVRTRQEPTKEKKERPCAKVSLCVYVQTCPPWNPTLIFVIKIPPPSPARSAPGSSPIFGYGERVATLSNKSDVWVCSGKQGQ